MAQVKKTRDTRTNEEQLLNAPYGMQGAMIINNTGQHYGNWYCIMAIADDTTISASDTTCNWMENTTSDFTTNLDLITGVPYYGDFSIIQLVDGAIIAYNQ